MADVFIVDEEIFFSNIIASAMRFRGHTVHQFFNATDAYYFFQNNDVIASRGYFWIDMYLLPGDHPDFSISEQRHDEYRVGLRLAELIVQNGVVSDDSRGHLILYSGHITQNLWRDIEDFCTRNGSRSFQKRADFSYSDLFEFVPDASSETNS